MADALSLVTMTRDYLSRATSRWREIACQIKDATLQVALIVIRSMLIMEIDLRPPNSTMLIMEIDLRPPNSTMLIMEIDLRPPNSTMLIMEIDLRPPNSTMLIMEIDLRPPNSTMLYSDHI